MPTLTYSQLTTLLGAILAILIALLDLWAFGGKLGAPVELILLGTGLGGLLGTAIPLGVAVANKPAP